MTITLCGENSFAIRQAVSQLVTKFSQKFGVNAIERLDGSTLTAAQLKGQVEAVTLFAPERLLLLTEASSNKELFAELGEIAATVSNGVTLVVIEGVLDKRTKTYKALKAATDFREFAVLNDAALQKWVVQEVEAGGGQITPQVARQLVERVGDDQWQLKGEIEKLLAHHKTIAAEHIELLVTPNLEVSAFALLDAAMAGHPKEATRLLRQLKVRSDPYEFFGLLVWQVQALALVAYAPSLSPPELAQQTGLKPFVVQKSQTLARRLGQARIKEMVEHLATLDMQLKSTGVEPWLLVEQAIAKIGHN